jgi:DDB1- and CUL4-associated factor 11
MMHPHQVGDDDDEDEIVPGYGGFGRRRRRPKPTGDRFPKIPSAAGKVLQNSGIYGQRDHFIDIRRKRKTTVGERLMWRRLGMDGRGSMRRQNRLLAQEMVPSTTTADKIIHYDSRAYSGQFSDDGNFFFSCTQNFKVRMYDTSNPYEWKHYKTVDYPFGQWTITDATLSPDNKFLAYSSIRHMVCLAPTDPSDHSEPTHLDFTKGVGSSRGPLGYMGRHGFGIWSLRFSGDGHEIVAGTSDHCVVVYDLERRQSVLKLQNHGDDVNAVCFGDKSSPHILYSGSDDQTLRVWDRRSMADGREAGVFVGHTEGLTYVDSKGDGRYVLSNGKDQMMKLWDLRKMIAPNQFDKMDLHPYTSSFDYRFHPYDESDYRPNPDDCSVVTFRGHSVLKTLIRCHFSPPGSTNSRYVYSGSEDGKVWIWNMDGTVRDKIDVGKATKNTRPRTNGGGEMYPYELHGRQSRMWETCVRDASWSPTAPVMAGTF